MSIACRKSLEFYLSNEHDSVVNMRGTVVLINDIVCSSMTGQL